jgi:hypothetical protein
MSRMTLGSQEWFRADSLPTLRVKVTVHLDGKANSVYQKSSRLDVVDYAIRMKSVARSGCGHVLGSILALSLAIYLSFR